MAKSARSRSRIGSADARCETAPCQHQAATDRRNVGIEWEALMQSHQDVIARSVAKLFGTNRRNAPSRQKRRAPFAAARCFWLLLLPPAVCRGGEEEQEEEEEEEEEEKEEEEAAAAARDADGLEAAACGAASR
ncbi:unnamed protein product [Prorocentrum cordatum]|uniref:Uncharacterized protein n=1 Tax=Prorocentrum cordatum TaxID=2364126 RepID=A0ABN9WTL4_9DINO|nr:unnamed protein product [Polarella glacialis]